MAKSKSTERDEQRQLSRRALIKWSLATGAALGVSRGKIAEILDKTAGKEVAHAAVARTSARTFHIMAGNGGFAWFQLLWPHHDVALAANGDFSFQHPGQATLIQGMDKPFVTHPDAPKFSNKMSAFMAGVNNTHNQNSRGGQVLGGNSLFAIGSALQATDGAIIRAITFGGADGEFGNAAGAATPANVNDSDGFVGLFNSAASRAGGMLAQSKDADLYRAQYSAFAMLRRAANRTTTKAGYTTGRGAAQFLGRNLREQLEIKPADLARYGVDGNTRGNVRDIARAMIVTVKSYRMGLTNCIAIPAMNDDPHGAWADGSAQSVPPQMKRIFDGFYDDLSNTLDEATGQPLISDFVMTVSGDTAKDSLSRPGWGDGTTDNSNWMYVYGAGHLKTGWFGGVNRNGNAVGFDASGNNTNGYNQATADASARLANAAVAYAIAKREERAITPFANGVNIRNLVNPKEL